MKLYRIALGIMVVVGAIVIAFFVLLLCSRESHPHPPMPQTRVNIAVIQTAVRMYEVENNTLPENLEQLMVSDGERPALLKSKEYLVDSWGTPIQYMQTGKYTYEIRSAGSDKIMDTADDITN